MPMRTTAAAAIAAVALSLLTVSAVPAAATVQVLPAAPAEPTLSLTKSEKPSGESAHPGGMQTTANEISYADGAVKVVIPRPGAAATCPSGWYCFFQYADFGGRMLQFRDCGGNQSLTDYGFGNRTTSWVNNTQHTVEVYDKDAEPFVTLWREAANSRSSSVGDATDNRADFFYTYCGR
ncbi:peptidase inhibitor family I36 protein [Streptomyces sp. NPDC050619]|uniref:peptidase inhibitor family I36 protein n=1 Tax=Streptomyces sp. NPDC050619 TaxID=3157214 RepID=UPI003413C718